eukprot:scaffold147537_cov20-Tisochrysis_lutea.AAC.2
MAHREGTNNIYFGLATVIQDGVRTTKVRWYGSALVWHVSWHASVWHLYFGLATVTQDGVQATKVCLHGSASVWQCVGVTVHWCGSALVWQCVSVAYVSVKQCIGVAVHQCGSASMWQCVSVACASVWHVSWHVRWMWHVCRRGIFILGLLLSSRTEFELSKWVNVAVHQCGSASACYCHPGRSLRELPKCVNVAVRQCGSASVWHDGARATKVRQRGSVLVWQCVSVACASVWQCVSVACVSDVACVPMWHLYSGLTIFIQAGLIAALFEIDHVIKKNVPGTSPFFTINFPFSPDVKQVLVFDGTDETPST